jgi:L-2-hydroxyglutarate oxidase LhgO
MQSQEKLTKADITIVGAGVMGASIAYQLSRRTDKSILVGPEEVDKPLN